MSKSKRRFKSWEDFEEEDENRREEAKNRRNARKNREKEKELVDDES